MKRLYSSILMLILSFNIHGQTNLWGLNSIITNGYYGGTIVKADSNGDNYNVTYKFPLTNPSGVITSLIYYPYGQKPSVYGISYAETIFEYDLQKDELQVVFAKTDSLQGIKIQDPMAVAPNKKIYGTTLIGGKYNNGVLFEYSPLDTQYRIVHHFKYYPAGGLTLLNGKLYGACQYGGSKFYGFIFEYDYNKDTLASFENLIASANIGSNPIGRLVATDSTLIGTTRTLGQHGRGALYEFNPKAQLVTSLHHFGTDRQIGEPEGNLVLGSNGKIYGQTKKMSNKDCGLFSYDLNNSNFEFLHRLDHSIYSNRDIDVLGIDNNQLYFLSKTTSYTLNAVNLATGKVDTIKYYDPNLYGMMNDRSWCLLLSGDFLINVQSFNSSKNGIISFNPSSKLFRLKARFNYCEYGSEPIGALTQTSPYTFYGRTNFGGKYDWGTIFKYNYKTNKLELIHDFDYQSTYHHHLTLNGSKLYGVSQLDGQDLQGCVHEIDTVLNSLNCIYEFGRNNNNNGIRPAYGLVNDNYGKLIGITLLGGQHNDGVIFQIDPSDHSFTKLHDFNSAGLMLPSGPLALDGHGNLLGISSPSRTTYKAGQLYSINSKSKAFEVLYDFSSYAYIPTGSPLVYNEKVYMASSTGRGAILEFDLKTKTCQVAKEFKNLSDSFPHNLMITSKGIIYGYTKSEKKFKEGVLFEFDTKNRKYRIVKKISVDTTGAFNQPLVEGKIYKNISHASPNKNFAIHAYPSPARKFLNISLENYKGTNATFTLVNACGQRILNGNLEDQLSTQNTYQFDLNSASPGVYFLHLNIEGRVLTHTFIKE